MTRATRGGISAQGNEFWEASDHLVVETHSALHVSNSRAKNSPAQLREQSQGIAVRARSAANTAVARFVGKCSHLNVQHGALLRGVDACRKNAF
jgi:hypothetical protein